MHQPIIIQGAGGLVELKEQVEVYWPTLQITLVFMLLENCPTLVSLGKICRENGCSYHQKGEKPPTIARWDPKSKRTITLTTYVEQGIPYCATAKKGKAKKRDQDSPTGLNSTHTSSDGLPDVPSMPDLAEKYYIGDSDTD